MTESEPAVLRLHDIELQQLQRLLDRYHMTVDLVEDFSAIPGSFWGDEEAGLIGNRLYVRADTPVHSALHETGHYVCMSPDRRAGLHTNAGGDYDEENGVCYLQLLLADHLDGVGRDRLMQDMDRWGYSFRLGSTRAWFEGDAGDAAAWLQQHGIITADGEPTWRLRGTD